MRPPRRPGSASPLAVCCATLMAATGIMSGAEAAEGPTFARDVAPILHSRCAACHRTGGSAPFSLLDYPDARKRAGQIAEVTAHRFMPPWLPTPTTYPFAGQRRLTEREIAILAAWAEAGAPQGDPAQQPSPPRWTTGWQLGEPDLVVALPEPFVLPAEAPADVFRNFVLPLPVERARWVRAVELEPGNPRVVHHAVMQIDTTGSARRLDAAEPGPGFSGMSMAESYLPDGHLLAWTPGHSPRPSPSGTAWRLRPGTDLVLQLHMPPTGRPERVQPRVALFFVDETPTVATFAVTLGSEELDIPAGEADYRVDDRFVLPVPVRLWSLYPHAHYLGREITVTARRPQGEEEFLLHIPRWDFDWQDEYRLAEPLPLPAGTEIRMEMSYDNSAANPRNPNQPPRRVRWGLSSSDEMAYLTLQLLLEERSDLPALERAELAQRLARTPDGWRANHALGGLLLEQGEIDGALDHLHRAAELRPGEPAILVDLGQALERAGRPVEALAQLRRAVEIEPNHPRARRALGVALAARGASAEALEELRRAVELAPDPTAALVALADALLTSGRGEEAEAALGRALELAPDEPLVLYTAAKAAHAGGRLESAIAGYRRAREVAPSDPNVLHNLGVALVEVGRFDEALEPLAAALEALPDAASGAEAGAEATVRAARAEALMGAGRPGPASRELARVVELAPEDATAHYNLAVALTLAGDVDAALPHWRSALAAQPRLRTPLADMARALTGHPDPELRAAAAALSELLAEPGGS